MGYMRHNAIVVTSWNRASIEAAANKARELGMEVLGPSSKVINGYSSIMICPDGSNEGWEESDQGDKNRASFREWLGTQTYDDLSTNLEWVEIAYGEDDEDATVEAHAWMALNTK